MPRPLPPVGESHSVKLSSFEALRSTRTKDDEVHIGPQTEASVSQAAHGSDHDHGLRRHTTPPYQVAHTVPNINTRDAKACNSGITTIKYDPQSNSLDLKLTDASNNTAWIRIPLDSFPTSVDPVTGGA